MPSNESTLTQGAGTNAASVELSTTTRRKRIAAAFGTAQSIIGLVIVCIIFSLLSDSFLSEYNFFNILRQSAVTAILAAGMVFVILTGGIDLSVGSVVAVAGIIVALLLQAHVGIALSIVVALIVGLLFGLANGVAIAAFRLPPFIVTLATMTIGASVALALSGGLPITGLPPAFTYLGQGEIGPVPVPVILGAIVAIAAGILLHCTLIGRYAIAIGSSEQVTFLSGVNTLKWKIIVYAVSGLLAGFAGVILTARQNSGQPAAATGIELTVIAAVVIGGTSLSGGRGSMWGAMVGTVLMTVINNGLNLLNVSPYYQGLFVGGLILAAVALDRGKQN